MRHLVRLCVLVASLLEARLSAQTPPVPPTIPATVPADQTVTVGISATFFSAVSGSGPFAYQWLKDGTAIPGATASRLDLPSVTLADAARYSFAVTNAAGTATSRQAMLTVNPAQPIAFTAHPAAQTLFQGESLRLGVFVSGSLPITYQWLKNGAPIAGATSSSFSINPVALSDAGSYAVTATNPAGPVTSNSAVVIVNTAVQPVISGVLANKTLSFGERFEFNVQATGSPPLKFEWKKDGAPAPPAALSTGPTSSSYSVSTATPEHSGVYTVTVTNGGGSATSNSAIVTVSGARLPAITVQPAARFTPVGQSSFFNVGYDSGGTGEVKVQWLKNGVPVAGGTSTGLSFNPVKEDDAGDYRALLTGAAGSTLSAAARLTVLPPSPPAVVWPTDQVVTLGGSLAMLLRPDGAGPFTYQWFKDGVPLSNSAALFNVERVTEAALGTYVATVANDGGMVVSPPIRVGLATTSFVAPAPWIAASQLGNIVYFLAAFPSRIERYDLAGERWLPTVLLGGATAPNTFLPLAEGVYVAYGPTLARRSPDLATETSVMTVPAGYEIFGLFAAGDFVYLKGASRNGGVSLDLLSVRRSTLTPGADNPAFFYSTGPVAIGPRTGRVYALDSIVASTYVVNPDGRLIETARLSPPLYESGRNVVFPGEDYLANNFGSVFRTADFTYAGSLGTEMNDLAFLRDGSPVVLRGRTLELHGAAAGFLETGRATLPFSAFRAFATDAAVVAFGAAATTGGPFSVAKVTRSEFAARPRPAVTVGVGERFSIEGAFAGADGLVGLLSRSKQAIVRWSAATRSYLAPVPLRGSPTLAVQSSLGTRVLLAYGDGQITEVPLRADTTMERQIGTTELHPLGLTDLGDMMLLNARQNFSTGEFRVVLGAQGQVLGDSGNQSYPNLGAEWLPTLRRLFSFERALDTPLRFETIPVSGALPASNRSGPAVTVKPPLRLNADGTFFTAGDGRVFNADLAQVGAIENAALDAAWLATGLFTVRATPAGDTEIQRWERGTYRMLGSLALRGTPLKIVRVSDAQVLVVASNQGFPAFYLVNADLSLASDAPGAPGVYAGTFGGNGVTGNFSLLIRPDRTGVLLLKFDGVAGSLAANTALVATNVFLGIDGGFTATGRTLDGSASRVIAGNVSASGAVAGTIPASNLVFSGRKTIGAADGAGFYSAAGFDGTTGAAYAIVGEDGRALLVASASGATWGGLSSVGADGRFSVTTGSGPNLGATLDVATGSLVVTGETDPVNHPTFAGLRDGIARTDRLANISTRGRAGTGEDAMIAGFVISGSAPRPVLVRAIGPALAGFGVAGALVDPKLILFRGSTTLAQSDNWGAEPDAAAIAAAATRLGAFSLSSAGRDAVLLATIEPGAYTAQVTAATGSGGVSLVEVYDAGTDTAAATPKLINIATRGRVGTGDDMLIAGIVVTGNSAKRVLVRAVGPTLATFGITGALADPVLKVIAGSKVLAGNDDWGSPLNIGDATAPEVMFATVSVGAFALPAASRDAALLVTLPPGNYSAQVSGKGGATGAALVEIYEVGN